MAQALSFSWARSSIIAGAAYAANLPHFLKKSRRSSETCGSFLFRQGSSYRPSFFTMHTPWTRL